MKNRIKFKYIYGPVASWRLGVSLGVDLLSQRRKICTFNCLYCQLGRVRPSGTERRIFVPVNKIIKEINSLPCLKLDYITFSGRGEPTLAKNLGRAIRAVKRLRKAKIAVITNASLMSHKEVGSQLLAADLVLLKLDAPSEELLRRINRPRAGIRFDNILKGIKEFRAEFTGRLALQIMFIKENKDYARELAVLANQLRPDEVQINTPLRPCAVKPLTKKELVKIKSCFIRSCRGKVKITSVFDAPKKMVIPISSRDTLKRRGK